jgi:hypothetical protein
VTEERYATGSPRGSRQAPVVLLELEHLGGPGPGVSLLADTVLARIDGQPPGNWDTDARRVAFVQDERTQARAALSSNKIVALPTDPAGRARALARRARYLTRRSVGVALGSGAAWGLSHIGVLEVLERERIPVDVIAGASRERLSAPTTRWGFRPRE